MINIDARIYIIVIVFAIIVCILSSIFWYNVGFRDGESKGFDKGLDSIDIDP